MSARAIRALRGSNEALLGAANACDDSSGDDDSSLEEKTNKPSRASAFAAMIDSDEEEEDVCDVDETVHSRVLLALAAKATTQPAGDAGLKVVEEEDLDDILDEFQAQDAEKDGKQKAVSGDDSEKQSRSSCSLLSAGLNIRDLDVDYSLRNSLMGSDNDAAPNRPTRGGRHAFLFGPARDGWVRPPHYVGGGMGMTTYEQLPHRVPWPYFELASISSATGEADRDIGGVSLADPRRWYIFQHSDSYRRDFEDYAVIQQSGDLNALIMFVAHHPYVTDALLQLSTVLYQSNNSQEGMSLLRRCLWIYECSALLSFTRNLDGSALMDVYHPENSGFFNALFKLVQVSNIAGLPRTALAVSRFLLSLDPLRDPKNVLVALDSYALASNSEDKFVVELVNSDCVRIIYRDPAVGQTGKTHECGLLQMPNWAYSYALALFRIYRHGDSTDDEQGNAADAALENAISLFPAVVGKLLGGLEVDTTGRSFRRDWVTVLDFATDTSKELHRLWSRSSDSNPIELAAALQACDVLIKVFVQQSARRWGDDCVLQWLYEILTKLEAKSKVEGYIRPYPSPPSPALARYASCIATDYENRVELLPQDAIIVDPGLVAHAMVIHPNRPRFLRHMQRAAVVGAVDMIDQRQGGHGMPGARQNFAGPPTHVVDPDWPLVEVFWRSFLPWNRVDGVPPPRR
jgi:hypothetical protein